MIGAVPLGSLGDRFGYRPVWALVTAVRAVVYAAYPFVRTFPEFIALACRGLARGGGRVPDGLSAAARWAARALPSSS
jgi:hypothetical protein